MGGRQRQQHYSISQLWALQIPVDNEIRWGNCWVLVISHDNVEKVDNPEEIQVKISGSFIRIRKTSLLAQTLRSPAHYSDLKRRNILLQ